jgi:hypothetical protein
MEENPTNYSQFFLLPPNLMIIFAMFTIGFFAGVFLTLVVFPPNSSELKEQEMDAKTPILRMEKGFTQSEVKVGQKTGVSVSPQT